jgi:hypothetical protein
MADKETMHKYEAEMAESRSRWPEGPWTKEPDRKEWRTRSGLPGLIVRNHMGALCGYAAVPPGHPAHGEHYDKIEASAHGWLTFADKCHGPICHVPAAGEPDDVWWFGFDCAHCGDLTASDIAMEKAYPELRLGSRENTPWTRSYKDIAYVSEEVEKLAEQLAAMK